MSEPVGNTGPVSESRLVPITNIKGPANELSVGQVREGPPRIEIHGEPPKQTVDYWYQSIGPVDESKIAAYIAAPHGAVGGNVREAAQDLKVNPFPGTLLPLGAAFADQGTKLLSMVVLGSSTAAGGNAANGLGWVDRLAARIGPRPLVRLEGTPTVPANGAQVYTGAEGGTQSTNYLTDERVNNIGRIKPTLVLHMVGSNDYAVGRAPSEYKDNMGAAVKRVAAASPDSVHVLIQQQGRNDITSPAYPWAEYGRMLSELTDELGQKVSFLNVDQVFRRMDGLPGADRMGLLVPDRVHLGNAGHRLLAEVIGDWLGFPAPMSLGTEVFDRGPLSGGNRSSGNSGHTTYTYTNVQIPPRPYPRKLIVDASIFARHVSGDWLGELSLVCAGSWQPRDFVVQIGTTQGINQALSGHFGVAAHWSGSVDVRLRVGPNATDYLTPNDPFASVTVQAIPE